MIASPPPLPLHGLQVAAKGTVPATRLRQVALRRQGLGRKRKLGRGLDGCRRTLEQLGYVQIDTISVVARAHHHTFFTRVAGYQEGLLNQLLARRAAFEYWCHAASYLPMRDYRFSLPMMRAVARGELLSHRRRDEKMRGWVRDRVRAEGPLGAKDFEDPRQQRSGWWDWKPAKLALEQLFLEGELMCAGRDGFQKRYDLAERVLPAAVDVTEPSAEEHADHVIERGLEAHGFGTDHTLAYFRRDARVRAEVRRRLAARAAAGALDVHRSAAGEKLYALPGALDAPARKPPDVVHILSPFDNAVIQRRRSAAVFGFDYTIECYLPEAKRQYGYFALPLVFRDSFVGRMDCKAHRSESRFEIKALFLDDVPEDVLPAFRHAVVEYAAFTGCADVAVAKVLPPAMLAPVRRLFA